MADATCPQLACCPPSSSSAVDCLVLGAGASGLAAAAALANAGLTVLCLEARDRLGGRVHTVALGQDHQQQRLDLGASWVHGTIGNPMAEVAARHGIATLPTDVVTTTLFSSCCRNVVPPAEAAHHERVYQSFCSWLQVLRRDGLAASAQHSQLSVAEAARRFGQLAPEAQHGLQYLINRWIEQEFGADASKLSALFYDADEPCEGDDVLFPGGYGQVIAALADPLPPGCVLLQHEVTGIRYGSSGGVTVAATTPQGGTRQFSARFAVVTFPIGVLKHHVVAAGSGGGCDSRPPEQGTMFDPPLPERKVAAIERLGVGLLNKVILVYDAAFWSATPWINRMPGPPHAGRWMEFFNLAAFLSLPALVAFNAGAWDAESDSDEELTRQVTEVLAAMFPAAAAAARSPRQVLVTRWGSDPWARGSYACMAVGSSMADLDELAAPVDGVLFFAGEAMSTKNQGTVHGAYATGLAAAEGVLLAAAKTAAEQ